MAPFWETISRCWKPLKKKYTRVRREEGSTNNLGREDDELLWFRDIGKHSSGDFSFAVVQANPVLEDYSQVDTGPQSTFVGIYDGHGGPEAAAFICNNLLKNLSRIAIEEGRMSDEVLRNAIAETENGFLRVVEGEFEKTPLIAIKGSCCLVGLIWKGTLLVANLGDSRAVLGVLNRPNNGISADQLTSEHNACSPVVREELRSRHPGDEKIVVFKNQAWRVKGIIQVTRSIGDAYLKKPEFGLGPEYPRFHVPEGIDGPVLRSDPNVYTKRLTPEDRFLIMASDGLWEHLTSQRAVEMVHMNPRPGIARRLVRAALTEAAAKAGMTYDAIKALGRGARRRYHDDITVVVVFIDQIQGAGAGGRVVSVKGFSLSDGPSDLNDVFLLAGGDDPAGPSSSSRGDDAAGPSSSSRGESSESKPLIVDPKSGGDDDDAVARKGKAAATC
ncbi:hypothetical protein DM860_010503 [Cuscuta australis]|uniref:protein-serine/threonine phosphatase n=1 Tax=Cuscuta australis TaxID=267555 RepID=A0A328E1D9_9ASTE|nr:hypothetical protein DM860_010503 [Cuscuta australis]